MKSKIIKSSIAIMAVLVMGTTAVFAGQKIMGTNIMFKARGGVSESGFEDLVTSGIISQETADKMKTFAEDKRSTPPTIEEMPEEGVAKIKHINIFDEMVTEGILTADELTKINEYQATKANEYMTTEVNERVARYVNENILSEAEGIKVKEYLLNEDNFANLKNGTYKMDRTTATSTEAMALTEAVEFTELDPAEFPKLESEMTIASTASVPAMHFSRNQSLVDNSIITAEQSEAMEQSDMKYYTEQRNIENNKVLETLVTDGKITAEDKAIVYDFLSNQEKTMTKRTEILEFGDKNEMKNITEGRISILSELVEQSKITQAVADTIEEVLFRR